MWIRFAIAIVLVGAVIIAVRPDDAGQPGAAYASEGPGSRFGKLPSPAQAGFAVRFGDVDPNVWPGDYVRMITLGEMTGGPAIRDGALWPGEALSPSAATYLERRFDEPVFRIGIEVVLSKQWPDDSTAALIISDGTVPDLVTTTDRPNVGMHLVVSNKGWILGVYPTNRPLEDVQSGVFDTSTLTEAVLRFEVRRYGERFELVLPDGTVIDVRDERINGFKGDWAAWELFERSGGDNGIGVRAIWAQ
ncbi:hypothetical protein Mycsm_04066 [Mycobacterium sp. JS623]|uniref:hypothetical protein n=1 Tax=Mycobacterium sp. JS623 TaxID=212767 RepID=UPI0002A5B44A|nr:hypothetical protein [Mycobacterium sp. JS623]AGB24320.1 hypothetical protein Mycsm_04066 [Mycobacterium sp. JS623]